MKGRVEYRRGVEKRRKGWSAERGSQKSYLLKRRSSLGN